MFFDFLSQLFNESLDEHQSGLALGMSVLIICQEDWVLGMSECSNNLLVSQQRRPLAVFADNLASRERITAHEAWHTDGQREDKEDGTNCEGEDPLKLENGKLGEELADTSGCAHISLVQSREAKVWLTESKNRQGKAHGVIFVCGQEEHAVDQDSPNEDIGDDSAN